MTNRSWFSIIPLTAILCVHFLTPFPARLSAQTAKPGVSAGSQHNKSAAYEWLDVALEATAREHERIAPRPQVLTGSDFQTVDVLMFSMSGESGYCRLPLPKTGSFAVRGR
ncbi:MAG: hypothetical protein ABIU09_09900 [Pyrinomonadaceae bacterium]